MDLSFKYRLVLFLLFALAHSLSGFTAPIHYFAFEGNADDSIGSVSGQFIGSPTLVSGYSGQGYFFNGSTDAISANININPSVLPELTIGAWVNPSSVSAVRQIISQDNGGFDRGIALDFRGSTGPSTGYVAFYGGNVLGNLAAPVDTWAFVAASYSVASNTTLLYVYDEASATFSTLSSITGTGSGSSQIYIGENPSGAFSEYFQGIIDEVFIFDQALTETEIDTLRINGIVAVPEPQTKLLYSVGLLLFGFWYYRKYKRR